jgi:hypothetical protein
MDYQDAEKRGEFKDSTYFKRPSVVDESGAVPGESFELGDSWYAKAQRLAGRFGVEQRGIERVPDNERTEGAVRGLFNVGTMVCS